MPNVIYVHWNSFSNAFLQRFSLGCVIHVDLTTGSASRSFARYYYYVFFSFIFSFYSAKCPHATPPAWIHIIFRLSSQEKSEEKWRFISLFRSFLLFSVRIVDEDSTRWFDYSISFSHHHGSGGCKRKERQRYDTKESEDGPCLLAQPSWIIHEQKRRRSFAAASFPFQPESSAHTHLQRPPLLPGDSVTCALVVLFSWADVEGSGGRKNICRARQ